MVLWDHLLYNLLNNISEFYPLLKSFDSFLQNKGALQNVKSMEEFLWSESCKKDVDVFTNCI